MSPIMEPKSKGGFNLGDYVEVKDRLRLFYEAYPTGAVCTEQAWVSVDDDVPRVWVKALAYRTPDDPHPGVGHSWMVLPGTTTYTRGSELENTETSAWGRAIGATGIALDKSIASADEVRSKEGQQDRPRTPQTAPDGREPGSPPNRPQLVRETGSDGLVGKVATSGTQDFNLRETPDGFVLPFRLKEGNKAGQIVVAHDAVAEALFAIRDTVIGQTVTVWGTYQDVETPKPDGFVVTYKVLHLSRIKTPDVVIPPDSTEAASAPLFPDDDLSDLPDYA